MVMTVLEAHVARNRIGDLESAWRDGSRMLPPGLVESFLVRDQRDDTLFRIVTIWSSREALEEMRASVDKPKGVRFFEAAGATPQLSIFDVLLRAEAS
jgi:heme-degrading monooxygenase HmoA